MADEADRAQVHEAAFLAEALASMPSPAQDEEQRRDAEGRIVCLGCWEPIPVPRLAANPSATRCVECQSEEDAQRKFRRA